MLNLSESESTSYLFIGDNVDSTQAPRGPALAYRVFSILKQLNELAAADVLPALLFYK